MKNVLLMPRLISIKAEINKNDSATKKAPAKKAPAKKAPAKKAVKK